MLFSWFKNYNISQKRGLVFVAIGLVFLASSFLIKKYNFQEPSAPQKVIIKEQAIFPKKLVISKVGLSLPIFPRKVISDDWGVSDEGAFYLVNSGKLGEKGNVVIYGHNNNELLGPIRWLEVGDLITISDEKGKIFNYKVDEVKTVTLDEVEIISDFGDRRVTLYTCSGFLDKERFVVVGKLLEGE